MKIISFLVFFICCLLLNPIVQNDWELIRKKNNIEVYSRAVEKSEIRELRAITTVDSDLSNLVAIIHDVEYYPNWVFRASKAEVLKRVSETEFYYYQVTEAPWPISNRDMIVHVKFSQNPESKEVLVILDGVPDYIKEKPGIVRVPNFNGKWVFTPLENGTIRIIHKLFIEPKGDIPNWLVNRAAVEGPYSTLLNMKTIINKDRFSNRTFRFLK
ncbi:MAG: START domain-containing protein [Bacteroidota bacterium]|nr:START domain-containing protein [Bacteroidota bacterium]